jgi:outer membrane protein assembly factor BamD (BamD/ComL family)
MSHWNLVCTGLVGAVLVGAVLSGCEPSERPRTSLFQQAEQHFKRGEYDDALDDYQAFLERFPRSPLAETARLRVRSINREVQSLMETQNMPEPHYIADGPTNHPAGDSVNSQPSSDATSKSKKRQTGGD